MAYKQLNKENLVVTKGNFNLFFETLLIGSIRAQEYNSECISTRDVQRAVVINRLVDRFIDQVQTLGYSLHSTIDPILKKHGDSITCPIDTHLKNEIDDEFNLNVQEYSKAIEYSINTMR